MLANVIFNGANMSDDNQHQGENQSQASSENQTVASDENTAPKLQAAEPTPKPEPSFGYLEFSEDVSPLTLEKGVGPPPKPDPSFETHLKEASRRSSQSAEKGDKAD